MALRPEKQPVTDAEIQDRFLIAQGGPPATQRQLGVQQTVRDDLHIAAQYLVLNTEPSRELSIAITKLEEALLWAGKAIFK